MALVAATITVTFTAQYAGTHRVCFRIQGSGDSYDCNTLISCVGGGTSCVAVINTFVDPEWCDNPVVFEGYVQPTCEDVLSTNSREGWSENYVPSPTCEAWTVTCAFTDITTINITDPGNGYTGVPGDYTVTINYTGDSPTQTVTTNNVVIGTGFIIDSEITTAGTSYVRSEEITAFDNIIPGSGYDVNGTYTDVPVIGTGIDATADVTISGGAITAVIVGNNAGGAYTDGETVTFADSDLGGRTAGSAGSADVNGVSASETICITDSGSGTGAVVAIGRVGGGGEIEALVIQSAGDLYQGPIVDTNSGSCTPDLSAGSGAAITLTTDIDTITDLTVNQTGLGYPELPTLTIGAPGGGALQATAEFVADPCDSYTLGDDCNSLTLGSQTGLEHLDSLVFCLDEAGTPLALNSEYTTVQEGCCADGCIEYRVTNTDTVSANIEYVNCGGAFTTQAIASDQTLILCAVVNSINEAQIPLVTITNTGTSCL